MKKLMRVVALFVAVTTLFVSASVHAQSNGLGITPRKDYSVQPGKSISDTIYISNLSLSQDLQVNLRIVDFGAQNETGAPSLQLGDNAPQTPWSLKPFLTYPKSVTVKAGKSSYIPVSIKVPADQGAGSYYSAIEYQAINPETKQKVNIAASSATLVFLTVPGNAKEQLILKQFGAWKSSADQLTGDFKSMFVGSAPKELAYRLQNNGNVAEQPSGSILVKNMFGRTALEIKDANSKKQLALIGQTRRIQVCLKTSVLNSQDPNNTNQAKQAICDDPGLWPGRYTAEVAMFYGLNGSSTQEIQAVASFWYIPWWSIVAFIVLILIIVALVWLIRRAFTGGSRRRYRR